VGNADFQAVATDQFLQATITGGRPGRRMPAWGESGGGLRPEEIQKIVGHLRQLGGVKEPRKPDQRRRWVAGDAAAGKRLFATNCAGCHGSQGEGLDAPALNNQALLTSADDTYLLETIGRGRRGTPMRSFREGSPVNPALSAAEIESLVAYLRTWEGK
jgi:mono/diheme cytochrome c family protein